MPLKNEQNKGERHKPVLLISVIAVIVVGIFLLILFFFHSGPSSKGVFRPGTILASESGALRPITRAESTTLFGNKSSLCANTAGASLPGAVSFEKYA